MTTVQGKSGARWPVATWGAAAVATAAGLLLSAGATPLPGAEGLGMEDVVDAVAVLGFGLLGVALLHRSVAGGLGRGLIAMSSVVAATWLSEGVADALATDGSPSALARVVAVVSGGLFIVGFVMHVLVPLLLFPTGRLPSARWTGLVRLGAVGTGVSVLAVLLRPGELDTDVPAWGSNPFGVDRLAGVMDALEVVGAVMLLATLLGALVSVVWRVVRYRDARRRQMWWLLGGATPMLVGLPVDVASTVAAQVASAVVIFGALLGSMSWALLGSPGVAVTPVAEPAVG